MVVLATLEPEVAEKKTTRVRFTKYLQGQLSAIFSPSGWPEWLGGILLGLVNILFFAWALKPFTIYTGFLNWGQHFYAKIVGLYTFGENLVNPLFERTSVGDIGLFLGALLSALIAGEFKLRRPSRVIDYLEGAIGGLLMALGVVLALGCNWGGFFSAITALSMHGYFMFIGLIIGGALGSYYVDWRARRDLEAVELELEEAPPSLASSGRSIPRYAGLLALLAVLAALSWYMGIAPGGGKFVGILMMGLFVGVVIQRSRFCFATAFRDILRGGAEFRRSARLQVGIALGIIVGSTGVLVLKYMGYVDLDAYVKPVGWSNIVGGILFGLGMVVAGGCASGSLWKAAEGHIKLWVALLAAVLSYAPLRYFIREYAGWIYGSKISIVSSLGWAGGIVFIYATMVLWIMFVLYLDYRRGTRYG